VARTRRRHHRRHRRGLSASQHEGAADNSNDAGLLRVADRNYDRHLRQLAEHEGGKEYQDAKGKRKPFSELSKEVRKRPGAAAEIDSRKRAIVAAVRLAELREQIGKTQTELAQVLEMSQDNVSRIEHSENLYLRTLADYVGALGGHIEVNAVFDDDLVPLGLVEKDRGSVAA